MTSGEEKMEGAGDEGPDRDHRQEAESVRMWIRAGLWSVQSRVTADRKTGTEN